MSALHAHASVLPAHASALQAADTRRRRAREADELLLRKARELAASRLEAAVEDIQLTDDGPLGVVGVQNASTSWAELAQVAVDDGDSLEAHTDFRPDGATFPFGTHVSVVEVDVETGFVKPVRHIDMPLTPQRVWRVIEDARTGRRTEHWQEPPAAFDTLPIRGGGPDVHTEEAAVGRTADRTIRPYGQGPATGVQRAPTPCRRGGGLLAVH